MIENLPTGTEVEVELADGTKIENLTVNGNNFVSRTEIDNALFENNLDSVKVTTADGVFELQDQKLIQNRKFGAVYMFVLASKSEIEKEKEQLEQLLADVIELILEVTP